MNFLAVDQGNTLLKATFLDFGTGKALERLVLEGGDDDRLLAAIERYQPECAAFCAVGRLDVRLVESIGQSMDDRFLLLTHKTPLPIGVDYATPDTLGLDRIATAAGAAALYPGEAMLVVDAGTAVTLDVVDASGTFRGGNISPGLRLRARSLHDFTAALPDVTSSLSPCPSSLELPPFGRDTHTALLAGVSGGLAREVSGCYADASGIYGAKRLLLTGGDAPVLDAALDTVPQAPQEVALCPDLLAFGLLSIYNYNRQL